MKLKRFSVAKDKTIQTKYQATKWEKIFMNYSSNRGLIPKIYKELKKLDIKRITQIKMGYRFEAENYQKMKHKWLRNKGMPNIFSHQRK